MTATARPAGDLIQVVETLKRVLPIPPIPTEPLRMILWENIGYLIDDERRRRLYDAFEAAVGIEAAAIAAAEDAVLLPLAKRGGMRPETRVGRWREIARIVLERCDGDLDRTLRGLPLVKAMSLLKSFPMIGDPGADKILLLSGIAARPSVESNGLRSMARLGFFEAQLPYGRSYKAAVEVLAAVRPPDGPWLAEAHVLLRELGKTTCKRGEPICHACPLEAMCPKVRVTEL